MQNHNVNIPFKTVFYSILSIAGLYFLYTMSDIVLTVILAITIVLSIEPLVLSLLKVRVFNKSIFNRTYAVLSSFLIVIGAVVLVFVYALPEVLSKFPDLVTSIEHTVRDYGKMYNISSDMLPNLTSYTERAVTLSFGVFSNIFGLLSLILLALYISLDWEIIKKFFVKIIPNGGGAVFEKIIEDLETHIGFWVKGQFLLMAAIGFFSTLVLYLLGNPFYLQLGLIAGLLEVVPILGPLISTILATLLSYAFGGQTQALFTLVGFYLIQVLENNFLVPKVMSKVSGFSPVLILLSFIVFSNFLGIIGAILAIPILMLGNILIKNLLKQKKNN